MECYNIEWRPSTKKDLKKISKAEKKLRERILDHDLLRATLNSYFAHFNHANSYKLKEKFKLKLEKLLNT